MNYAVVIPTLNPDSKMTDFVDVLVSSGYEKIILVNDGSSAETVKYFEQAAAHPQVTVLTHEVNRGKGAGLKTAFRYLAENCPDVDAAITADADGQHTVDSINRCTAAFAENPGSVIFGGREFSDKKIPFRSRFGNKISSVVYRFSCGIKLNDTQTGLRIVPAAYFEPFSVLKGDRYEYETHMIIAVREMHIPYVEVPIETIYIDDNASSHFNPIKDSARIYKIVLGYFFKFLASSLISWVVDIAVYTILVMILEGKTDTQTMEIIAGAASRIISSIVNFILNRKVVFKAVDDVKSTAIRYYILAFCQMGISIFLVNIIADTLLQVPGLWHTVIKCIVDGCLFIFSYGIQRKWVFKNKKI
ncbi:MAG: bifunctional glycosyltransferase family 2/GtrA family protein [Parasporobacterium sp.]|nr:bifunctional glycosyltransferase family 2/GtrA family protein [Parasporobacterium sp.]